MNRPRTRSPKLAMVALTVLVGCFDEPPDTSNLVFGDDYAAGVGYQAFARSKLDAARRDPDEHYAGIASLGFRVPTPGEPGAGEFNFSGGAFTSDRPRDLSRYTALTFWAKASRAVAIGSMGLGNDNTGTSQYQTETTNLALTTEWARYVLPIPAPQKLTAERGLFWLAAGAAGTPPTGYDVWFDDVQFERLDPAVWNPRPTLTPTNPGLDIGASAQIAGTAATYTIDGRELTVGVMPATFDYTSSNPAVATVNASGVITATGNGTAVISATLAGVAVPETITVTVPAPELTQMALPVTFDSPTVDYGLVGFGGAENSTIVVDPQGGPNRVARVVRSATAEVFAGTTLTAPELLGFATPVPFTATATTMTVRVYTPAANLPVRLKVEDHTNAGVSVETETRTTMANAWETLTFNFANHVAGTQPLNLANRYDKATLFFDFGAGGAAVGERTYFFDDVAFGGGGTLRQMDLPVTFDATDVRYGLLGFGGAEASTIAADPAGGTNQVGRVVKSGTAELWAGTTLTADGTLGFASAIPFTATATRMTVRVYSPAAGVPVRLKVEDHADATHSVETEATTTVANAWETLTFNFANHAAGTAALDLSYRYDKASIFFNFGTTGAATGERIYFFDDVAFGGGTPPPAFPTITFSDAGTTYTLTGFGGAEDATVVADPTLATNQVARVVKSGTAELWAGTTVSTGANNTIPRVPFTATATRMTVRVWSPHAGIPVRLKLEDAGDPTHSVEAEATVTVASGWQTLTIDFANQAAGTAALNLAYTYNRASLFFNFGTTGAMAGERIYFFDDLAFGGEAPPPPAFPTITFSDAGTTYTLTGFGGAEDATVVADPTLATNQVARVVKSGTAELWAGTTVSTGANNTIPRVPFTATATRMTVRVWSPHAGIPVRLKLEDAGDPTHSVEAEATVTVASGWQTLTIDFANQAAGTAALNLAYTYNRASIFFNFGTTGAMAGERIYFFDDLAFGGEAPPPPAFPTITFSDAGTTYTLTGFGGAEDATVVADPTLATNQVARVVKSGTAELWAGTTVSTGANNTIPRVPFTATATRMTVRVWSPHAGIPVRLKLEDAGDPTHSVEAEATVTVASGWQTLTIDFANQAAGTAALNLAYTYNRASLFFNFGTTGAMAGERIYFFDDLAFGGEAPPPPAFPTITFSDAGTTYTLTGFGGAEDATVVADPTLATNQVARVVKSGTAELWAGTTVSTGANNTIPRVPFTATATRMTVRVWSPHAGIPVRLKLEDAGDPTHSVEAEATVTVASGWQTLTIDFANQAAGTAALNLAYTYNRASLFFNFGTTGAMAGERIYFFDDLAFAP
jgi:hypothetical protein